MAPISSTAVSAAGCGTAGRASCDALRAIGVQAALRLGTPACLRCALACTVRPSVPAGALLVHERVVMLAAHWWVIGWLNPQSKMVAPQRGCMPVLAHAKAASTQHKKMLWLRATASGCCATATFQPPDTAQILPDQCRSVLDGLDWSWEDGVFSRVHRLLHLVAIVAACLGFGPPGGMPGSECVQQCLLLPWSAP